jgi:metallo-beta-lactamase class B
MKRTSSTLALAALIAAASAPACAQSAASAPPEVAQLAEACEGRSGWSDPAPPAHIFGNSWYVGTCGISAILITGEDGHVLIDGGLAESAPLVLANIAALGFDAKDVRWILSSHEHFDHAGALAALKRATGARFAALASAQEAFESGKPDPADPQLGALDDIEPVAVDRILTDGDSIVVGPLAVTAHATPAHAPGSTSWTWQSCTDDFSCLMIAYADSASTISADGYRFSDHDERRAQIDEGLSRIAGLTCDILLTPHPSASGMMERFAGKAALVDTSACRAYATTARENFAARLAREADGANEARP